MTGWRSSWVGVSQHFLVARSRLRIRHSSEWWTRQSTLCQRRSIHRHLRCAQGWARRGKAHVSCLLIRLDSSCYNAVGVFHGRINDRVISANGVSLENVDYNQAIQVLRECGNTVNLLIKRRALVAPPPANTNGSVNELNNNLMKLQLTRANKKEGKFINDRRG